MKSWSRLAHPWRACDAMQCNAGLGIWLALRLKRPARHIGTVVVRDVQAEASIEFVRDQGEAVAWPDPFEIPESQDIGNICVSSLGPCHAALFPLQWELRFFLPG